MADDDVSVAREAEDGAAPAVDPEPEAAPASSEPADSGASAPSSASEPEKRKKRFRDLPVRLLSGAVYVVLFVACLFFGRISTAVFIAAISGVAAFEFFRMMREMGAVPIEPMGVTFAVLYPLAALVGGQTLMLGLTFVLMSLLLLWFVLYPKVRVSDLAITLFGPVYTGLMLSSFVLIRMGVTGYAGGVLALMVYASVVANDSFAYLVGSRFGKHKLVPRISPKKSWEGFLGGVVASALVWLLVLAIPSVSLHPLAALAIGAVCGVVGLLGDLAESRIKRGAGVKDSGKIMPGHGGILDRVDSLILVSFVSYLLLKLVGVL